MPIIIIGGGGHAKVIADILFACRKNVLGFVDKDPRKSTLLGLNRLGDDDLIRNYNPQQVMIANGLGSVGPPGVRKECFIELKERGYEFVECIHPSAVVSPFARLGEGIQVMAGAVIQPGVTIGDNSIINTRASIDHDCKIGAHVHIAPGVTLSGDVTVRDRSHVGTGASVIQGVKIGEDCLVGAGAVVVGDVGANQKVMGVPARARKKW